VMTLIFVLLVFLDQNWLTVDVVDFVAVGFVVT
jgi:hypothetical protein